MSGKFMAQSAEGADVLHRDVPISDLIGCPEDIAERLNTPHALTTAISDLAVDIMSSHHSYNEIHTIDGVKYRISKGNEHFPANAGVLDEAYADKPYIYGFRLVQKLHRKHQEVEPIMLVVNGNLRDPIATIQAGSAPSVMTPNRLVEDDTAELRSIIALIAAIKEDSVDRVKEARHVHEVMLRRRARQAVAGVAMAAVVTVGVLFGPDAKDAFDRWQTNRDRSAQEAKARKRAAEAAAQRDRDQRVQNFDNRYDVEAGLAADANKVGVAQASSEFDDVRVPEFDEDEITPVLAHDLSEPRSFAAPGEDDCDDWHFSIDSNDTFKVVQDGGANHIYTLFFDAESDTFSVCEQGTIGHDNSGFSPNRAEHIIVQRESS